MLKNLDGSLLLVEGDSFDAELVLRRLDAIENSSLSVRWVTSLAEAVRAVHHGRPIVVLTDLRLPDAEGLEVVRVLTEVCPDNCPVIVQTHVESQETALAALQLGAQDYLRKADMEAALLERSIRFARARNHIRAELSAAESKSAQSASELEDFAHIVAHDLRAPVRTARLFADRLLDRLDQGDELAVDFGIRLERSLHRVDDMIVSTLDYASLRGLDLTAGVVDVGSCIDQATSLLRADLVDAGGQIRAEVEPGLTTRASDDQLLRVFLNTLGNSIKYRRDSTPLEIAVLARADEDRVRIDLVDNGIGLPAGEHERAFQLLERLDAKRSDGLGFGLPIARRIVEGLGGTIDFAERDQGAHLQMVLPSASVAEHSVVASLSHG